MKNILVAITTQILALLLLVSCQSSKEEIAKEIFSTDNLPTQSFVVSNDRDTILQSINNLQIKIPKNAFVDSIGNPITGEVNLSLKEAITLADMIIGGFTTTTTDGKFLESAGMFNLSAKANNQTIFIKKDVNLEVTISANGLNTAMQHFTGEVTANNQIKWKNPVPLTNVAVLQGIDRGKELFNKNCSQCHAVDKEIVGSALYNLHKVQNFKWFSNFTRYPQKTIESGDKRSVALYSRYKQYMPNYDFLTDKELKDIWDYIKNESALLDKDSDRKKPLMITQKIVDSLLIAQDKEVKLRKQSIKETVITDTIYDDKALVNVGYTLFANNFGWFNYDSFLEVSHYTPINFSVMLNGEYENSTMSLVLKERKAIIDLYKFKNNIYSLGGTNNQVRLPKGEKAIVIATCYKKGTNYVVDNIFFAMQEITLGKDEMITITPQAIKSIDEPMKRVKEAFKLKN